MRKLKKMKRWQQYLKENTYSVEGREMHFAKRAETACKIAELSGEIRQLNRQLAIEATLESDLFHELKAERDRIESEITKLTE